MMDLLECTALITGASSGIGAELARQLAPIAGRLILVARREDRLIDLGRHLKLINPAVNVEIRIVDLSQQEEAEALADWIYEQGFELDLLINNAGLGDHGFFETASWPRLEEMLQVNLVSLTYLTHRLIPLLRRNRPAAIMNVSSMASLMPVPGLGVYAATKAYVSSFSEALRAELRGSGIGVTHVCPGPVETEFGQAARRPGGASFSSGAPDALEVSVEQCAREALEAVANDHARRFPGTLLKLAAVGIALAPMFILRAFLEARVREIRRLEPPQPALEFDPEADLS
ncbi:MAG: SDR family oxidoreductase [Verrucomicrobia bacterium]|nr:SDR family oxidoreductase [Verrucomicrobiota bacterium]